jgi:hypothetical protein
MNDDQTEPDSVEFFVELVLAHKPLFRSSIDYGETLREIGGKSPIGVPLLLRGQTG